MRLMATLCFFVLELFSPYIDFLSNIKANSTVSLPLNQNIITIKKNTKSINVNSVAKSL